MAESKEVLKSILMREKELCEKLAQNSAFKQRRSWHPVPSLHGKQMGKQYKQWQISFSWAPKSRQTVAAVLTLKDSLEEKLWETEHIKKQRYYFANKGSYSQSCGFYSSHVWMWELNHKEAWVLKNWCFWCIQFIKKSCYLVAKCPTLATP